MNNSFIELAFILFSARSVIDDIRVLKIRRSDLAIGMVFIAVDRLLFSPEGLAYSLFSAAIATSSFILIGALLEGKLGQGDVWFSAFVGLTFGFWKWNISLIFAAIFGLFWISILRISGRRPAIRDIRIPFVPFMFAGALAVSVYRVLSS